MALHARFCLEDFFANIAQYHEAFLVVVFIPESWIVFHVTLVAIKTTRAIRHSNLACQLSFFKLFALTSIFQRFQISYFPDFKLSYHLCLNVLELFFRFEVLSHHRHLSLA